MTINSEQCNVNDLDDLYTANIIYGSGISSSLSFHNVLVDQSVDPYFISIEFSHWMEYEITVDKVRDMNSSIVKLNKEKIY